MKLSILIPSLPERKEMLEKLCDELLLQILEHDSIEEIEILVDDRDRNFSIGEKRNFLLDRAQGKYLCFFDDDDFLSDNYIKHILEGISKDVDCVSLRGEMTTNGNDPELFEHSIKYNVWKTDYTQKIKHERNPNHLNVIKSSIAKQFKFPNKSHGEDFDWSKQLQASGLIKTEHYVNEITYFYRYISRK